MYESTLNRLSLKSQLNEYRDIPESFVFRFLTNFFQSFWFWSLSATLFIIGSFIKSSIYGLLYFPAPLKTSVNGNFGPSKESEVNLVSNKSM